MSRTPTPKKQTKRYQLKPEHHDELAEDIDVGELPSIVLSDDVLEYAQELTKDPTNIKLLGKLKNATFKDPEAARKMLSKIVLEKLSIEEGVIQTTAEIFQDIPTNVSNMFEEIFTETQVTSEIQQSTDNDDFQDFPPVAEDEDHFVDLPIATEPETSHYNIYTDPTIPDIEKWTIHPKIMAMSHDMMNEYMNHIDKRIDQVCDAVERINLTQDNEPINQLRQVILGLKSDITEVNKKLDNIECIQNTQKLAIAEITRRLGMPASIIQAIPSTSASPKTMVGKERKIGCEESNLMLIIKKLIGGGLIESTDQIVNLVKDLLMYKDPETIKEAAQSLNFNITQLDAQYIMECTYHTRQECNRVLQILTQGKSDYLTNIASQVPTPTQLQPESIKRPLFLSKLSKRG